MNEERNVWVGNDVGRLARGRVGGHDDDGRVGVGRRGQVGVVHEGHVGHVIRARGQVKLFAELVVSLHSLHKVKVASMMVAIGTRTNRAFSRH